MDFIELLKVIFLGIVEGITEWLPISSTGHLILVEEFVKLDVSKAFWEMFMVVIQLGAILAVVVLYWNKIWPFQNKKPKHENVTKIEKAAGFVCRFTKIDKMVMWFKILVSCLPAIIIGLPFDDFIEEKFNNWFVVAVMLMVYGVLFLLVEDYNEKRTVKVHSIADISWKMALYIGIFQVLALIPGNFPLRCYHYRRNPSGSFPYRGGGIHLFPGNSRHVWGKPFKDCEIRSGVLCAGTDYFRSGNTGVILGVYSGN